MAEKQNAMIKKFRIILRVGGKIGRKGVANEHPSCKPEWWQRHAPFNTTRKRCRLDVGSNVWHISKDPNHMSKKKIAYAFRVM